MGKRGDGFHGEQLHREDLLRLFPGDMIRIFITSKSHRDELRNGGVIIGESHQHNTDFYDVLENGTGKIFYIPINRIGEKYEIELVV